MTDNPTPSLSERIEALAGLEAKSTPGPWADPYWDGHPGDRGWWVHNGKLGMEEHAVFVTFTGNRRQHQDANLIVALRNSALDIIREQQAEIERLRLVNAAYHSVLDDSDFEDD